MPIEASVVIVGGGPAGCSAALTLRAHGQSVALVGTSGQQNKPTEVAAPHLRHLLNSIGAPHALRACDPCVGIASNWGRETVVLRPSILAPFGDAWFVHRERFDTYLQQAVRDAGATWIEGIARNLTISDSGVAVETATGILVRAQWLVIATGSPSWAARVTRRATSTTDSLIACWASLPTRRGERVLLTEATDSGWWYLCPGDGENCVACFVTDSRSARLLRVSTPPAWNKLFRNTFLSRQLGVSAVPHLVRTTHIGVGKLAPTSGPRWIAAGDAAVKLDPLGSSGICTALESGVRAGIAVSQPPEGRQKGLGRYDRWSTGLFTEFVRQRMQHYSIEAARRGTTFWTARLPLSQAGDIRLRL